MEEDCPSVLSPFPSSLCKSCLASQAQERKLCSFRAPHRPSRLTGSLAPHGEGSRELFPGASDGGLIVVLSVILTVIRIWDPPL